MQSKYLKLTLIGLLLIPTMAHAASKPRTTPLPKGVPEQTYKKGECILPSELKQYAAYIESSRVSASGCTKGVVAPAKYLRSRTPYASGSGGTIYDCVNVRDNEFNSGYLETYLSELAQLGESATSSASANALCAANMLYIWAKADAMSVLDDAGDILQAEKDRMWQLAGVSSVYLNNWNIRKAAENMPVGAKTKNDIIREWLSDIAHKTKARHDELIRKNLELAYVNTQFWRAYSLLPTALLNQDPELLESAKKTFMTIMYEIEDGSKVNEYHRGFLPLELNRLNKSLMYHAFGAYPIVAMAVLSRAYGCDFAGTSWRQGQIERLIRKTIEGRINTDVFEDAVKDYTGKNVEVEVTGSDAKKLLILTQAISGPNMNPDIIAFVKKHTGETVAVKDSFYPRLGGNLSSLAETAKKLSALKSAKLKNAGLCLKF